MNEAERLLRRAFRIGERQGSNEYFSLDDGIDPNSILHEGACYSLFGPSGEKEMLIGREAILKFIQRCRNALSELRDEITTIISVDEECVFVRARAWRKSKLSGEEIDYEWAMLFRIEKGMITYGCDMLDTDAQAFWGRIADADNI